MKRFLPLLLTAMLLICFYLPASAGSITVDTSGVFIKGVTRVCHPLVSDGSYRFDKPVSSAKVDVIRFSTGEVIQSVNKETGYTMSVAASMLYGRLCVPADLPNEDFVLRTTFSDGTDSVVTEKTIRSLPFRYPGDRGITSQCKVRAGGNVQALTDNRFYTFWNSVENADTVSVTCPDSARSIVISWNDASPLFCITCSGDDENILAEYTTDTGHQVYRGSYPLPDGTTHIRIWVKPGSGITDLHVFSYFDEGNSGLEPLPDKTDLMVFSAHLDDELLWFGGAIPSYAARGKTVGMVYMTKTDWIRRDESMRAMWSCGVKYHPVYLDMYDYFFNNYASAAAAWEKYDPVRLVVATLRRYKPEVVLTHDPKGEYGHFQHILTSEVVASAVTLAADETYDPDSVSLYGAWQVKKLYKHLYPENRVFMAWDDPVTPSGLTSLDVAYIAYEDYASQHAAYTMRDGRRHDYREFGLVFSAVGPDIQKNDFFENIP